MLLFEGVEVGCWLGVNFGMAVEKAVGFRPVARRALMGLMFANEDNRGGVGDALARTLKDDIEDVRAGGRRMLAFREVCSDLVKIGGEALLVVFGVHEERESIGFGVRQTSHGL